MESYDISNLAGTDIVASMVVFQDGKPLKSAYKRFKVEGLTDQDDYASMHQVLLRRLTHYVQQDAGFAERPDVLLPTLGGQTGLNAAVELAKDGTLDKYGVEMIGCDLAAIERGEDRKLFNEAMAEIGLEVARSGYAYSVADAEAIAERVGYPCVLRPSFTLGGAGGGIARDEDELVRIVSQGLELSPAGEVLVEESIEGWKEYEMEVMRDAAGNGIIVCSIENFDPMGVHTGDSITCLLYTSPSPRDA